jgi:Arc/MetJ-type ribon-helix-helix transcriptional regulator
MMDKITTLRIPESMADELAAVARADHISVSEVVREAIENHLTARRSDEEFKKRLKQRLEEDREILERLSD